MNTAAACNLLTDSNRKIRDLLTVIELDDCDSYYTIDGLKSSIEAGLKVWTVLHYTRGVWLAADYSYKAREICNRAWTLLDRQVVLISNSAHIKKIHKITLDRYRTLRESLRVLEFQYHEDETQRLGASVSTLTGAGTL